MARYIDADAFKQKLTDKDIFFPALYENELDDIPTADVVPKSEYDAVVSAVDNSTKEFLKLHDKYQDIKREAENYKSIAETQQKLSMERYFEIKQLEQELDEAKDKAEYLQSELDLYELIYDVASNKQKLDEAKAEVARAFRKRMNEKMGKHTHLLGKEYVQRIMREVEKEYTEGDK